QPSSSRRAAATWASWKRRRNSASNCSSLANHFVGPASFQKATTSEGAISVFMTENLAAPLPAYHDRDCDLSIIRGKRVAVIGYGSQGRTHALNLRDSGVADIVVGLKATSATREKAQADGFPV